MGAPLLPQALLRRPQCGFERPTYEVADAVNLRGEADQVATMVLSHVEGALLLARTYRSLEPIQRAEQALKLLARVGQR